MTSGGRVFIGDESPREFTTLQGATDYAMTRATVTRPVTVVDEFGAEYIILKRDTHYTITLSRML